MNLTRVIFITILSCAFSNLHAAQLHYQPLAEPLLEKSGTRTVTDDWLVTLPTSNNFDAIKVEWLDNTHLVYALPPSDAKQQKNIKRIDVETGSNLVLGAGENPKPSPDGQWIVFTKGIDKDRQLWLMRSNGTGIRQLTHESNGLGTYKFNFDLTWSSDSKYIAVSHPINESKIAIDAIDIANVQFRRIISCDAFQLRLISWSPDKKELFFWSEQVEGQPNTKDDIESIQVVDLNNGTVRTLIQLEGLQQYLDPVLSPDGKKIAIAYDPDHPYYDTTQNIGLINIENIKHSVKRLTHEIKLTAPHWSRDGESIFAVRNYGVYNQIFKINVKTGELKQLTDGPYTVQRRSYALSPDGKQLAFIAQNAHATRVLRIATSEGRHTRDLITIQSVPDDMALSEAREIEWDTLDYPSPMRGLLLLPLHYQAGTRYPLIVDIHGGGTGATLALNGSILSDTPLEWQMWAAKGYAVFVPEFRSSGSFGSLADTRDRYQEHDIVNRDIIDVEMGVYALIANGIVDNHRMAVIGQSSGARRANWLLATRHQFQAIVSREGWADDLIEALTPCEGYANKRASHFYGGSPQAVPQNYLKNSALLYASNASTSTLFLMGNPKLHGRDFDGTVDLLYRTIKTKGVETQYQYYPDEGHAFLKSVNRLDALQRSEEWIANHFKSATSSDASPAKL